MSYSFSINIVTDKTDEVLSASQEAVERALEAIGIQAENYAKELCPVDTGNLRNSITHAVESGEKAVYIGTNVEYAPYVEMGTSRMRPQPYIKPAVMDHMDEYKSLAEAALKGF